MIWFDKSHYWCRIARSIDRFVKRGPKGSETIRCTERAIEIPLALWFIQRHVGDAAFLELGYTLPYYIFKRKNHVVYDLIDDHYDNVKREIRSLHDAEFSQNILSVSTIEHIGLDEYGIEVRGSVGAVEVLRKIMRLSPLYFVTFPMGHNPGLDEYVKTLRSDCVHYVTRDAKEKNVWHEERLEELTDEQLQYGGYCAANTICIITNVTNG